MQGRVSVHVSVGTESLLSDAPVPDVGQLCDDRRGDILKMADPESQVDSAPSRSSRLRWDALMDSGPRDQRLDAIEDDADGCSLVASSGRSASRPSLSSQPLLDVLLQSL